MRATPSHLLLCLCLLLGFVLARPACADVAVAAKQFDLPGLHLQDVNARLADDPAGGVHLQLQAARVDVAAMGWRRVGLRLDGQLQRDAQQRWVFDGRVQLRGAPGGALSDGELTWVVNPGSDTMQIELRQDKAQANAWLPLDQLSHAKISLRQLPAGWLQGLLGTVWSGRLTGGRLDADLALDTGGAGAQSSGQFTLDGVGFDSPGGRLAGQRVDGKGRFDFAHDPDGARIGLQGTLDGGELLLGPLYAKLPAHPVQLDLGANVRRGAIELDRLRVSDADALQLEGALAFDAKGDLQKLRLDRFRASFPAAYQRYGQAWLATLGLRDVRAAGHLSGNLDLRNDGLHAFAFDTEGLQLADGSGRFAVSDLRGAVDWSAQGDRPATTLGWSNLQFYRIANGATQSRWQSRDGTLALLQPIVVPVFKGQLRLASLDWRPAAAKGQRLATSLAVTGVDMASFSHALGWPSFPGTLGGAIPSLRLVGDRLELEGGLSVNVFDGFVDVTHLSVQQPFGDAPVLAGNISLKQLDLGALTSVFNFGSITGRLDGSVDNLRLVNWNPVAFDASLIADGGGRISQRAVNNLTTVGGGGLAGGLQGAMLKLFKTFGYKRIGLNCKLRGAICEMGGLGNEDGGYTIVEGSGLPHLEVIGHQTKVDWPTLVRRLREAVNGHAPVVR
ncbi:hypothetical protein [Rhodanobacter sp. PCA2]|uniref:hypothetical protein n=1 Tax=Rhodanobacter sp. PCA2 TaxID=2006117 RepID=UPI0015E76F55|nr:hypothetical protein [Rhodanobacter sp. PCA2]MBA2078812.1 hypothetical protein [Rhodanobacter sp. PCA2]